MRSSPERIVDGFGPEADTDPLFPRRIRVLRSRAPEAKVQAQELRRVRPIPAFSCLVAEPGTPRNYVYTDKPLRIVVTK